MSKSIQDVEGIGPKYAEQLQQAGVKTTDDLLEVGGTRSGRKGLAEKTSINEKHILKWVNMCDLSVSTEWLVSLQNCLKALVLIR